MKQTIRQVLDELGDTQINLGSEAARETIASLVSAALKTKGTYTEFDDSEIEKKKAQETWVCDVCDENTYDVDWDYIGSGTNHLACELELETKGMTGHDHGKVWPGLDNIKSMKYASVFQKQIYNEMTADGLPPGGDAQAVKESHKLAEEMVNAKKGDWIYESPDGGKTVFRRPFSDTNPENKEEIDWETKEPTGRIFTDYPFEEKGNER